MKTDNKGFSFIELIITITLLTALVGFTAIGIGSIAGIKAKSCAEKLVSYLDRTKTDSLGFDNVQLKLYQKSDESYWVDIVQYNYVYDTTTGKINFSSSTAKSTSSYMIGEKVLNLKVVMDVDESVVEYNVKQKDIYISFNRSSGSFNKAVVKDKGLDTVTDDTHYIKEISIQQGTRTPRVIKCIQLTGKFYLE